jgi:Ca-activated chloride channel family protein
MAADFGRTVRRAAMTAQLAALGLALALTASRASAACIFFPGKLEDRNFQPDADLKREAFGIRFAGIQIEVEGGKAKVRISESFDGFAAGKEALCLVPLPEGADGRSARLTFKPAIEGAAPEVLTAAEAQALYENIAKATKELKLLTYTGRPALLVRKLPKGWLDRKIEATLEYEQAVASENDLYTLSCLLPAAGCARGTAGRVNVNTVVRNAKPIRGFFSPSHETVVERSGLYQVAGRASVEGAQAGGVYRLCYAAADDPLGLRVLAYREPGEAEGYFLLFGNPTGSEKPAPAAPKDVIFALDTSGSMRGEKNEQSRAAVNYCLDRLNPQDRFNVITFGTEVQAFRDEPAPRTPENLAAAKAFVEDAVAAGRTNISEALRKCLAGKAEEKRPRFVVFLTDGAPTAGELRAEEILKKVPEWNAGKSQVFVLGVGHGVNVHLLDKLALATGGSSEYVPPDEEIDVQVAALFNRLSHPVLNDVQLTTGELRVSAVYPKQLPALFRGSQFMVSGRYRDGGAHTITLSGTLNGKPESYTCKAEFPKEPGAANEYVASLWAARAIGFLLQEIRLHGENQELIAEVVRLSRKYGIVTEYTAFLSVADAKLSDKEVAAEAGRRMREANAEKSGAWAFNQRGNELALQAAQAAPQASGGFLDRSGRRQEVQNVRQVGRRAFYLRDGRWVEEGGNSAAGQELKTVKLFSDEYFELLRNNPDFAKAQELGAKVEMEVNNTRIQVQE